MDDQLELGWQLDRQIGRQGALELLDIAGDVHGLHCCDRGHAVILAAGQKAGLIILSFRRRCMGLTDLPFGLFAQPPHFGAFLYCPLSM